MHMHVESSCTGLSQVTVNSELEPEQTAMLLCNNCASNKESDLFLGCQTIERMNEKEEAEQNKLYERLQKMETRLTVCMDKKIDNAIKALCEKADKSYVETMATQPEKPGNDHTWAPTKTMSDMNLNFRESARIQVVRELPEKSKAEYLYPTTDVMNRILEGVGVTSPITKLRRLGIFDSDIKKPRTLLLTLATEHEARLVLAKAFERRHVLNNKTVFVLPALSIEDTRKESLCLGKRRQLLEQNVPHEQMKFRNLEFFNDGVRVAIEDDQVNES